MALLNNFIKAIEFFDICLNLSPNLYNALCGKASALLSLSNNKEASAVYTKAILVAPTKGAAYFGKSQVLMEMGNTKRALLSAEKAYVIDPNNELYRCHYNTLRNMT